VESKGAKDAFVGLKMYNQGVRCEVVIGKFKSKEEALYINIINYISKDSNHLNDTNLKYHHPGLQMCALDKELQSKYRGQREMITIHHKVGVFSIKKKHVDCFLLHLKM